MRDLKMAVNKDRTTGTAVIVTGNFKSKPSDKELTDFLVETYTVDIHQHLFQGDEFPTYSRGQERIDYAIVTRDIFPAIESYTIFPKEILGKMTTI